MIHDNIKKDWHDYIKKHGDEKMLSFFDKIDGLKLDLNENYNALGFVEPHTDQFINYYHLCLKIRTNHTQSENHGIFSQDTPYFDFLYGSEKASEGFFYTLVQNIECVSETEISHSKYFLYIFMYLLYESSLCDYQTSHACHKLNKKMDEIVLHIYALFTRIINIFNVSKSHFHMNRYTWKIFLNESYICEHYGNEIYLPCTTGILQHLKESKYIQLVNHNAMSCLHGS